MDYERFDHLLRDAAYAPSSRRTVYLLLAGGALGGVAARLGLTDGTEAKAKHQKAKRAHKRKSQPERKAQGQIQAEGKGKKKRHKKPKSPAECDPDVIKLCNACEEPVCAAGDWVCRSNGEKPCPDGSCVAANACCPDKYRCDDGTCVDPLTECCPDQKDCGGGVCVQENACCPGKKHCPGYDECFAADECCPNTTPPLCAECDKVVCENGSLVCRPKSNCCPTGMKKCNADGPCFPEDLCCFDAKPTCHGCQHAACAAGDWVCASGCGEDGDVCCGGRCVSTDCGPGKEWDSTRCRCVSITCTNASDICYEDWATTGCGTERDMCYCKRSTSGDTHCLNHYSRVYAYCHQDSDCDKWYGEPGKGFCDECLHYCYAKGCPYLE